ncbi:MAG: GNAT family N-acetyltransferase [Synergistaceae bacterium]|jgi:GNAT superfamily N-acetyltransferase|nr:GNAT family N-acetyltransferase [Synergistaceae bacterium]
MGNGVCREFEITRKLEITEISREIFDMSSGGNRLALYYASSLGSAGRYLAAFCEGAMIGYAICMVRGEELTLFLLFVQEGHRCQGVAARLLEAVETSCHVNGENIVKCCLSGYSENFSFMKDFLEKRNYALSDKLFVFWCDGYGDPGYAGWERYMSRRGDSLLRWLEEEGFSAMALEDAGPDIIDALRDLGFSGEGLNVSGLLDGKRGPLSKRVSCLTVKDGRPVAFCMANTPDDFSVVFEQIGVAPAYQNSGAILPAISASIRRCRDFGYSRLLYSIFESNAPALSFAKRVLSYVTSSKKVQYNYFKKVGFNPKGGEKHGRFE